MISPINKIIKKYPILEENRTALLIIVNVLCIYAIWKIFILFVGEERFDIDDRYWPWFSYQWELFNQWLRELYLISTAWLLGVFGHSATIYSNYRVHGAGIGGVAVGNYCLGIQLFWFFGALIVLSKGVWWRKMWYIPTGIVILFVFNVFRMLGLCYAVYYYPEKIDFNHDYIFNMIMYVIVFLMHWLWGKFFSKTHVKKSYNDLS